MSMGIGTGSCLVSMRWNITTPTTNEARTDEYDNDRAKRGVHTCLDAELLPDMEAKEE